MMGLETIRRMNAAQTVEAETQGVQPYVAISDHDEGVFGCPTLGDYVPSGWNRVNTLFVDQSGFGMDDEPALSINQFLNKVKKGFGYGIGETGQFQLYIHVFEKD